MRAFSIARRSVERIFKEFAAFATQFPHLRTSDCALILEVAESFVGPVFCMQGVVDQVHGLMDQFPQNLPSQR